MLLSLPVWMATLGLALLNAYWQFALLCLLYFLLRNAAVRSASGRFGLAFFLCLSGTCWFCYDLFSDQISLSNTATGIWSFIHLPVSPNQLYACLATGYLIVLFFLAARQLFSYYHLNRRSRVGRQPILSLEPFIARAAFRWRISKRVRVFSSVDIRIPQTIGFFKPIIFFPVFLLTQLTIEQVEAILLHELAHIKRKDYLINLLLIIIQSLFFFNPFVTRLIRVMREEREHACDELVIAEDYAPGIYSAALLQLEQSRQTDRYLLAATGISHPLLLSRIRRMNGLPDAAARRQDRSILWPLLLASGIGMLCSAPVKWQGPALTAITRLPLPKAPVVAQAAVSAPPVPRLKKAIPTRQKRQPVADVLSEPEPPVLLADDANEPTVVTLADQRAVSEFAQPDAEGPALPDAAVRIEMPYIPSASFIYQHAGDSLPPENHQKLLMETKINQVVLALDEANAGRDAIRSFKQQLLNLQQTAARQRAQLEKMSGEQKKVLERSVREIESQSSILRQLIQTLKKPRAERLIYI